MRYSKSTVYRPGLIKLIRVNLYFLVSSVVLLPPTHATIKLWLSVQKAKPASRTRLIGRQPSPTFRFQPSPSLEKQYLSPGHPTLLYTPLLFFRGVCRDIRSNQRMYRLR